MAMPAGWKPNQLPPTNLGPEQIIWKNNVMTGIINRKVAETQVITNYKVMQNQISVPLTDLDDIIVMNSHREFQSQRAGIYTRGIGTSFGTGRGRTVGDVVFMYSGRPVVIFRQIPDPTGVCRLAKTARRSLIAANKQAANVAAKSRKEKEREIQDSARIQTKENRSSKNASTLSADSGLRVSIQITCSKCGFSNSTKSRFCVKCGNSLTSTCSKCGRNNPTGSAFCNKCGFALA